MNVLENLEKEPSGIYSIRFQDCDPMGHLNNARYLDYILNAREDHLEKYYDMRLRDFISTGAGWVAANHDIYYLKPAGYNEKIKIQTSLIDSGDSHIIIESLVSDAEGRLAKALIWTRFVFVNVKTGRKENHSAELLDFFRQIKNEKVSFTEGSKTRVKQLLAAEKQ